MTGVFNVGSGTGSSLNELLALIERISDRRPEVEYKPRRMFDVQRITLDITRARRTFQWAPTVSLEDGVRRHWQWLNDVHGAATTDGVHDGL